MQKWLSNFSRVGFELARKKRLDEMELVQRIAFEMLIEQRNKPEDNRDDQVVLSIMDQIGHINKRLTALQNGSPVIAVESSIIKSKL